jgi:hypothetical protein
MHLREIGWEDVDWIKLAQDRDQWRASVFTIMNQYLGSVKGGEFLDEMGDLASQEGLFSLELREVQYSPCVGGNFSDIRVYREA